MSVVTTRPAGGPVLTRLGKAPAKVRRLGVRRAAHLLLTSSLLPLAMRVFPFYVRFRRRVALLDDHLDVEQRLEDWRQRRPEVLEAGRRGYRRPVAALGIEPGFLDELGSSRDEHGDIVLADIDQDGFLLSRVGPLAAAPTAAADAFLPRDRFTLRVVERSGVLAVRKDYRGDRAAFLRELSALHDLGAAGCNVPAILDYDVDALTLTMSYVIGTVLRERLAERGAVLRNRDRRSRRRSRLRSRRLRDERVIAASALIDDVLPPGWADHMFAEMRKVHSAGYVLHDVKYGNIIVERDSGLPYLIDFEAAQRYPSVSGLTWRFLRDLDYEKFNLHFGADALTHERVRRLSERDLGPFYAPVYVPGGLRFGPVWNVDVGHSRWDYLLKEHLPPLQGGRVLDLGAGNGFLAMQMLRNGAREVVAVERDGCVMRQAGFVQRLFEWADGATYDLTCVHLDMRDLPGLDLGRFDLVTALCSIYFLRDDEIADLVRFLSERTRTVVLQCNTDRKIRRADPHTFEKASVDHAVTALRANGFPHLEVVAPPGYSRPLVIGRHG